MDFRLGALILFGIILYLGFRLTEVKDALRRTKHERDTLDRISSNTFRALGEVEHSSNKLGRRLKTAYALLTSEQLAIYHQRIGRSEEEDLYGRFEEGK